jgi:simple sugar transport system permease protein
VTWRLALEKRLAPAPWAPYLLPPAALALALLLGAPMLWLMGAQPWATYQAMAFGAFGDRYGLSETLVKAAPLLLTGLAVGLASRVGFWNIGAEGQFHLGAMGGTWTALHHAGLSAIALQPLMLLLGWLAGAAWALLPGVLRVYARVNEVITTLMLNYIALLWVDLLVYGPWKDPQAFGFPFSPPLVPAARLPTVPGSRVHLGFGLGILAAMALTGLLWRTRIGYEMRMVGLSPAAARYAGIEVSRVTLCAVALSGGLAGLAGVCEVAGVQGQLKHGLSPGYGYTAIIVAWLARLHPIAIVGMSVLLGALLVGSDMVQLAMGLPVAVAYLLQGLILFTMLGLDVLANHRLALRPRPG